MDYVKIPLKIAQRAARNFRPMMPYVRKHIAENRLIKPIGSVEVIPEQTTDMSEFIIEGYNETKAKFEKLTKADLIGIGKDNGLTDLDKLKKQDLIDLLLGQK